MKNIGRAAAADSSDRIHQTFVIQPGSITDRRHQAAAQIPLRGNGMAVGAKHGHAPAHRRRCIRHYPHHGSAVAQVGLEEADRRTGGNGEKYRTTRRETAVAGHHVAHDLGLDCEDHNGGREIRRDGCRIRQYGNAVRYPTAFCVKGRLHHHDLIR